jgi:hypothetical protein
MKINYIEIENFRCFLEPTKFMFGNGLNIINAENGSGKSELLNAIYWVIYGKIFDKPEWVDADNKILYPLWYTDASNKKEFNENIIVTSVCVSIDAQDVYAETKETTKWWFTKTRYHERNPKVNVISKNRDEIEIKFIDTRTGETKQITPSSIPFVIEELFPLSIRDFMWFQGEGFINQINLNKKNTGFDDILNQVSYFPIYTKMKNAAKVALNKKENELNKAMSASKNLSSEKSEKLFEQSKLQKNVPELEAKLSLVYDELEKKESELTEVNEYLDNVSEHAELSGQIKILDSEIKSLNDVMDATEKAQVFNLISRWVISGSGKKIEAVQGKIDVFQEELRKLEGTQIPKHIPGPEMIREMLRTMNCDICDRKIEDKESKSYKTLEERLIQFETSLRHKWLQKNFDQLRQKKRNILREYKDVEREIKALNSKISSKRRERNNKKAEVNVLQEKLDNLNSGTIANGGANYEHLRNNEKKILKEIKDINFVLRNRKDEFEKKSKRLEELNTEIENFEFKDESIKKTSKDVIYFQTLTSILSELEEEAKQSLLHQITIHSNKLFKSYYHNPQVKITLPAGEIKLINPDTGDEDDSGNNESQSTAARFSIINALLKISSEKLNNPFPLIADAPTSSFGWDNTFHFTTNIGDNFQQVIILSKDYIQPITADQNVKTDLISACKEKGGSWYWIEQVDTKGVSVGRNNTLPKSKCKSIIKEKIN